MKRRILFFSEAITTAQIVRLVALARSLDPEHFDIHFAASHFPEGIFGRRDDRDHPCAPWTRWHAHSMDGAAAMKKVADGKRLYAHALLKTYVADDQKIFAASKPDLVVGDLRWSLPISAPVARIPHVALINAYWSPYVKRDGFPLPDHPIVRWLGEDMARKHFPKALPQVFRHFAAPVNRLRRSHGLPEVGDLLDVLVHADHTIYADVASMYQTQDMPASHHFIGPVLWNAAGDPPAQWGQDPDRAAVYVTLGSSGDLSACRAVANALASLPVDVLWANAGRTLKTDLPPNIRSVDFVDGNAAARRAKLVIHNGGSSTGYQALAQGTPVLNIPHNFDQHLASERITQAKAGVTVNARSINSAACKNALEALLTDGQWAQGAKIVQQAFGAHRAEVHFPRIVQQIVDS